MTFSTRKRMRDIVRVELSTWYNHCYIIIIITIIVFLCDMIIIIIVCDMITAMQYDKWWYR